MKNILITGFEPFLEYRSNPTEYLINELAGSSVAGWHVDGIVLPVEYEKSWDQLQDQIESKEYQGIICFGLAAERKKLSIEIQAVNSCTSERPDNAQIIMNKIEVLSGGESVYPSTLGVEKLNDLSDDFELSQDAGGYVCNYLFYRLMSYLGKETKKKAGFIHIPASFQNIKLIKLIIQNL